MVLYKPGWLRIQKLLSSSKELQGLPKWNPVVYQTFPRRKITWIVYDEQYLRAYGRQHSQRGRQMKKLMQSNMERGLGSLTQYYGLLKTCVLGKAGAHKVMLLAAVG